MKVLFLAPYPIDQAPSQRFRFEFFLKHLEDKSIIYRFQAFYSDYAWKNLYLPGKEFHKILFVAQGFLRRILILPALLNSHFIFIHREVTPLGPPVFEWLIAKILRKKVIFDFDDAIWMNDGHDSKLNWLIKARWKIASICKWSWKVTAGNEFLAGFAKQYCKQVIILPTVVNTDLHAPMEKSGSVERLTIGWTGSHSTLFYLNDIVPVLSALEKQFDFNFLVIANRDPELKLKNYQFLKWKKETEAEDLRKIDIGIMPLEDSEWSKGKCGFKLIQYLSIGVPAVASPVGVNSEIISDGKTGFLASNDTEWQSALRRLLENEQLRKELGANGRNLIEEKYSVSSQTDRFVNLFES